MVNINNIYLGSKTGKTHVHSKVKKMHISSINQLQKQIWVKVIITHKRKKIIEIIVWVKNNSNNSVIMAISAIIYAGKNKWNNSSVISEIIVLLEQLK